MNSAGANLKVDGIMGPKTLGAVRAMQMGGQPSDKFSPVHPTAGGQGTYTMSPIMNPQASPQVPQPMGPTQQQDPFGFGASADGDTYGSSSQDEYGNPVSYNR